jgi:hypothetical protein
MLVLVNVAHKVPIDNGFQPSVVGTSVVARRGNSPIAMGFGYAT